MGNCCDCDDEPAVELDEPSSAPENEDGIGPLQSTQSFPVLKAGWVLLQGEVVKSVWKRRWLELSADALRYYKKEGGKDYNISPDVVVLMQDILNVQRESQHGVRLVLVSADAAMRRQKRTSRSWIEATMKGANANRVGRRSAKSARSSHFQCEDDYDRSLAYVHRGVSIEDFTQRALLRNGHAEAYRVNPNTHFHSLFQADESYAKREELGLWGDCR